MLTLMRLKRCPRCEKYRFEKSFASRSAAKPDYKHSSCVDCGRAYRREHYRSNPDPYKGRARLRNSKSKCDARAAVFESLKDRFFCVDCGEKDPFVLDFDHVRGVKIAGISKMLQTGTSVQAVLDEVKKCDIRCANCHRRKTARERGWVGWSMFFRS